MKNPAKNKPFFKWLISNPLLSTVIVFLFLFSVVVVLASQRYQLIKNNRKEELEKSLNIVEMKLYQFINANRFAALTLALTIQDDGEPKQFEQVAKQIVKDYPQLKAVQLVPDGVIKYMYPVKGNEKAIGLSLFKSNNYNSLEAEKAIRRKRMYFQGPFELTQGGTGVVGRVPLFVNQKFWGFSAIVIRLDTLLKSIGLNQQLPKYYQFQLSKINPISHQEEFFADRGKSIKNKLLVWKNIPEGDWKIYLADSRSIFTDFQFFSSPVLGLLLCILSGFLFYKFLKDQGQIRNILDAQAKLLASAENKYKIIFDYAAIGIARVDTLSGQILEANAFLADLLGYSEEELKHKKVKSLIYEEDLSQERYDFKRMRNNDIRGYSSVRRYLTKNNEVVWTNAIVSNLWDNHEEQPKHHLVLLHDIGKQKIYEEELLQSHKHIENLMNTIEGVVWEADIKDSFRCTFISAKVKDMLGYTPEETMSTFTLDRVHPDDLPGLRLYYREKLFKQIKHIHEYRVISKDNSVKWVRDIVTVHPNLEDPQLLRGIMIDITSIKEAENALQKSYDLLNEQNKRLLNFSYIVSHNLRSHASNMEGVVSLLKMSTSEDEKAELINLLQKVSSTLNTTLLNLNKIVDIKSNINLEKEKLGLSEYINSTIGALKSQILKKEAFVDNQIPDEVTIVFNKAYLESVLLNLLSNALRYAEPNRKPNIVIKGMQQKDAYLLSVIDNGVGIDLEKFGEKIFGFNQTFHGNEDARGLGLFITKSQIEAMNGSIAVESTPEVGTVFTICFRS